jgi:nicotinate phosphoribosyltransferase
MGSPLLATDGYKFSMAEAGWPLRRETFYYSHRKGGQQVVPLDIESYVHALLPTPTPDDYAYLAKNSYEMGAGFKAAIQKQRLVVRALPQGARFYPREPVFTLTGSSALVSWLEPLLLQLNFRIQVASVGLTDREALTKALAVLSCEEEKRIALETLDAVGVQPVPMRVDAEGYHARVLAVVKDLVQAVSDPSRIFEVGLRAATCMQQHEIALRACLEAGVTRTSNVHLAEKLGMIPVGTMGHEHVQRYGQDEAAFRAIRERRPERSSFLLDTYDTVASGLPTAFRIIHEEPNAGDSIRFDSGDKKAQYTLAVSRAKEEGIKPVLILEDGLDARTTREFEALRAQFGWAPSQQFYGYGGFIVARTMACPFTRDRVAAVYKLSCTGHQPTMKFGNELAEGKQSIPGTPVVFRRVSGSGPVGLVGQHGESAPEGYVQLSGAPSDTPAPASEAEPRVAYTAATQALVDELRQRHFPRATPPTA